MDNATAQSSTVQNSTGSHSYVDAYMPPAATPAAPASSAWDSHSAPPAHVNPVDAYVPPSVTPPVMSSTPAAPFTPPAPSAQQPLLDAAPAQDELPAPKPVVELSSPVVTQESTPAESITQKNSISGNPVPETTTKESATQSEELEDQNIFAMLGVTDGTPEQRETFLDELQQVIWEDFLEYDVKLLITRDEQAELAKMLDGAKANDLEQQEKVVVFLEKLIPDLEEIMLEKALELKEEMMRERIKGMLDFFKDKPAAIEEVRKAENMINIGKWYSAATLLNSIR